jgi:hypothetical protein
MILSALEHPRLRAGDVWTYRTRPGEEASTLTILATEIAHDAHAIVHVRIDGVRIPNPHAPRGASSVVGHMPFALASVEASVVARVGRADLAERDFDGYAEWRAAFERGKAGVFTLDVADAVDAIAKTFTN